MACGDVLSLEDLQTAKKHQIFEAEVITGKAGGVAGGGPIDYATNQVTGQVQKTMPAILRDLGFVSAAFDFTSGGTLTTSDRNTAVLWPVSGGGDGDWYVWGGALQKVVPARSTPSSTGGVTLGAWSNVGSVILRQELAAPGGAGLIGPGVMSRGLDKFSIMQGRDGEYRQDTLTRGLAVELSDPITGGGFGGATNTYMFNRFRVKDDRVDAQNDGTSGTKVDGLIVQHDFGGAGTRGGRHAAEFMLTQKAPTESDNVDRNYVGIVGYSATSSGDGGTSETDKKGAYFGANFYTSIKNAPFVAHANGCESNVMIDAASSVYYRTGYSSVSGGALQATKYDAAYSVGALGTSGAQWRDGILMGVQNGRNPISRSMIRGEGLSLSKILSFSGNIPPDLITSDTDARFNFKVDRLEMFYPSASLKLGAKDSVNTPVIEAYTDATGNRAGRIVFSGTATTVENGVCNIQFRQTVVRELAPGAANTYTCGTASLPWSGGFTQAAFTVTSDENHKTPAQNIPDTLLDAWGEVQFATYQFLDRVEAKGRDGARWHFGVIAQRVVEALERHGLVWSDYAFICLDKWDSSPATYDDNGCQVSEAVEAGEKFGIRYEEALVLEAALQRRERQRDRAEFDAFKSDVIARLKSAGL